VTIVLGCSPVEDAATTLFGTCETCFPTAATSLVGGADERSIAGACRFMYAYAEAPPNEPASASSITRRNERFIVRLSLGGRAGRVVSDSSPFRGVRTGRLTRLAQPHAAPGRSAWPPAGLATEATNRRGLALRGACTKPR
jgi:hypothetical protein